MISYKFENRAVSNYSIGDLSTALDFSRLLVYLDVSPGRYAEVTGWDRRSIVHWCKNGVPQELCVAVYESYRFWNSLLWMPKAEKKPNPYTKRTVPNFKTYIHKFD